MVEVGGNSGPDFSCVLHLASVTQEETLPGEANAPWGSMTARGCQWTKLTPKFHSLQLIILPWDTLSSLMAQPTAACANSLK